MLDSPLRSASPRAVAALLILTSVASLQLGAAVAATVFPIAGPVALAALRMTGSAGALTLTGRGLAWPGRTRGTVTLALALGVVLAVMNTSVYLAIDRLPLGTAVTLEFLGPLGVALAGSRRPRDVVLVLAAGLLVPALLAHAPVLLAHPQVLLIGLAVGVLSSAVTNSLEQAALRRVEPALVALLMSLHPAAATAAGLIVLAQALTLAQVTGTVLVTVAAVSATARRAGSPARSA